MMRKAKQMLIASLAAAAGSGAYAANTVTYSYDDLNRLTAVTRSDGPTLSYTYDEVGNVTVRAATNPDSDGDGLKDIAEINVHGSNPTITDSDLDGLSDGTEVNTHGTDPTNADTDGDGFSDGEEIAAGTDPLDPASKPAVVLGDLTGDGVVDVADLILAERILLGQVTPTADQLARGDVAPIVNYVSQPDGVFDTGDLLVIQRRALGQ